MVNLVEDILDLSRFEFNKFKLNNSWFFVVDLIEEVFQLTSFIAVSKNIDLTYTNENIFGHIYSDQKRLKQVLLNLVTNALKFTFQGSVCVKVSIQDMDEPILNEE
jgi:two-component system sensor histidine kinase/response regulator